MKAEIITKLASKICKFWVVPLPDDVDIQYKIILLYHGLLTLLADDDISKMWLHRYNYALKVVPSTLIFSHKMLDILLEHVLHFEYASEV